MTSMLNSCILVSMRVSHGKSLHPRAWESGGSVEHCFYLWGNIKPYSHLTICLQYEIQYKVFRVGILKQNFRSCYPGVPGVEVRENS